MSTRCNSPFYVKNQQGDEVGVPCGKCKDCMSRRISGWSFRLMYEMKRAVSAHFVTLTYDTKFVPLSPKGYMTLDRTAIPRFMKRLRKLSDTKLKYYAAGEYGSRTWRPHYHMILFNANVEHIESAWRLDNMRIGDIHIGHDCGPAAIGYTLKYMSKPPRIPQHQNDDRVKEFALMSKGLGDNYLSDAVIKWHKDNLTGRMYVPIGDGKKIAMPRYYKNKLYSEDEKSLISQAIIDKMSDEYMIAMRAAGYDPTVREDVFRYADFLYEARMYEHKKMHSQTLKTRHD